MFRQFLAHNQERHVHTALAVVLPTRLVPMKRVSPISSSDSPAKRVHVEDRGIDALLSEGPVDIHTLDPNLNGGHGYIDAHLLMVFPYRPPKGCAQLECRTFARSWGAPVNFSIKLIGELGKRVSSSLAGSNVPLKVGLRGARLVPAPPTGSQGDSAKGLFLSGSCLVFTEHLSLRIGPQTKEGSVLKLEMDIGIASHDLNEPRPEAPTNSTIPGPQIHGGRLLVGPGQSEYQSRIPSPSSILSSSPTTASPSIRSRLYSPPHSQGFTPPSLSPLSTPEMGNATLRSPSFSPSEDPSLPSECLTQHQDQEMAKDLVHEGGTAASPGAYRGESSSQEPVIDEVKAREGSWESVDVRPTPANFWDSESQVKKPPNPVISDPCTNRKPQGAKEDDCMMPRDTTAARDSSNADASALSVGLSDGHTRGPDDDGDVSTGGATKLTPRSPPLSSSASTMPGHNVNLDGIYTVLSTIQRDIAILSAQEPSMMSNAAGVASSGSGPFGPPASSNTSPNDLVSHYISPRPASKLVSASMDVTSPPIQHKSFVTATPIPDVRIISNGAISPPVPSQSIEGGRGINIPVAASIELLPAGANVASLSDDILPVSAAGGKKKKNNRARKRNKLRAPSAAIDDNSSSVSTSVRPSVAAGESATKPPQASIEPSRDTVPQSLVIKSDRPYIPPELLKDYDYVSKFTANTKPGGETHVIGIVTSAGYCGPVRGREANNYRRAIVVSDVSGQLSLNCFVFNAETTWLPQVSVGDVLLLRQLKASTSRGAPATGYAHKFRWAVFDRVNNSYSHGPSPSAVPCADELCNECGIERYNPFWEPTEYELQYMAALDKWWNGTEKERALGQVHVLKPKKDKSTLISDVTPEDMAQSTYKRNAVYTDLIVEVVKDFGGSPREVLVTDYTTNPSLNERYVDHPHGKQQLKVTLWDTMAAMGILEKEVYHCRNMRIVADKRGFFFGRVCELEDIVKVGNPQSSAEPRVQELLKRKKDYFATLGPIVAPKESVVEQVKGAGEALNSISNLDPNQGVVSVPAGNGLRPTITIDPSLRIARKTVQIMDIIKHPSVPAAFIVEARVADYLPVDYREFVVLVCPTCGTRIEGAANGARLCLDCKRNDLSPSPPVLVYQFRICLQDLLGDTLPVLVGGPEAERFLGQPPTSDPAILEHALDYRIRPLAGNIAEYKQGVSSGKGISRHNGPMLNFCVTSFRCEGSGEPRYKLSGCSLEIFDPEMEAAKNYF